jgi:hypothetical protein
MYGQHLLQTKPMKEYADWLWHRWRAYGAESRLTMYWTIKHQQWRIEHLERLLRNRGGTGND